MLLVPMLSPDRTTPSPDVVAGDVTVTPAAFAWELAL
jgi:hypothetical protein